MGASYRPENPFAKQGRYRPENPYVGEAEKPRDLSGIRDAEALGYAPPVRPESSRQLTPGQVKLGMSRTAPTIGSQTARASGQPSPVNPVLGAVSKGVHGALLSGSDELAGALSGLTAPMRGENPLEAYRETAETVRGINRGFSAEHPVAAAIAELTGAVGGGMGAQSLVRAVRGAPAVASLANPSLKTSLIRNIVEGTAAGAGAGATAGLMGGEGSERLEGMAEGGGLGAAGGLVFGAAAPLIGEIAAPVARPLATKFGRRSYNDRAKEQLIRSIARGGNTPRGALARAKETPDIPLSLADDSENTTALARVAQSYPGTAKDVIAKNLTGRVRQEVPVAKLVVGKALKMQPEDIGLKAEELVARTRARARPLYEKAYKAPPIDDDVVREALKDEAFLDAYRRGQRIAKRLDGVDIPDPKGGKFTVQGLDYMKRGLDDHIGAKMRTEGLGRTEALGLRRQLDKVLARVDEIVPDYKKARTQFRGDKEAERALEEGRNFWKTDAAAIERRLGKMTPEEQKLYRAAALDQVMRRLSGTTRGRNAVARINRNEDDANRLRALVGNDKDFQRLMKDLDALELTHATSNKVLQNSVTQRLKVEQGDFEGSPADAAMSILSQGAMRTAANAVGNRLAAWQKGVTEGTAEELAPMLTATGPQMEKVVVDLESLIPRLAREAQRKRETRRAVVAGVASSAAPERRKQQGQR